MNTREYLFVYINEDGRGLSLLVAPMCSERILPDRWEKGQTWLGWAIYNKTQNEIEYLKYRIGAYFKRHHPAVKYYFTKIQQNGNEGTTPIPEP